MFCENAFDRCWRMSNVGLGFIFYSVFNDCVVLEGPNGNTLCILYWFYICFAKIDVRVCGRFPVFENLLFYGVFLMISNFDDFIVVLWMFCGGIRALTGRAPGIDPF